MSFDFLQMATKTFFVGTSIWMGSVTLRNGCDYRIVMLICMIFK